MKYYCCTNNRRKLIEFKTNLNGIDYLEIVPKNVVDDKQKTIQLHFIKDLVNPLTNENIIIRDGTRITDILAINISSLSSRSVEIDLSNRGNFSIYTLCIREETRDAELLDETDNFSST